LSPRCLGLFFWTVTSQKQGRRSVPPFAMVRCTSVCPVSLPSAITAKCNMDSLGYGQQLTVLNTLLAKKLNLSLVEVTSLQHITSTAHISCPPGHTRLPCACSDISSLIGFGTLLHAFGGGGRHAWIWQAPLN
jgi:hypothetical protein